MYFIYATKKRIINCLQGPEISRIDEEFRCIEYYLLQDAITIEQGVLAFMHGDLDRPLEETLQSMGLLVGYDETIVKSVEVSCGDEI